LKEDWFRPVQPLMSTSRPLLQAMLKKQLNIPWMRVVG